MIDNKLLLPWTDGKPIVWHVVESYVEAKIAPDRGRDRPRC